ncbi:MT-A70 family methyltransferase [Mesorhizobium australicum]|uniref:MT-A70 family methyltransferase n=1 Tax=Mesorhizobium australicum TaxID=536018 RepID=UPI001FCCE6D8|nr:MT-A70 family methyltransferase [Mesorhizobium australicum]
MNAPSALSLSEPGTLPAFVRRAAEMLAAASSAAEVLDARDHAAMAYDAAKRAARLATAKGAHDEVVAAVYRAQADALEIESLAKRRLADEYDAALERGDVAGHGGRRGNQFAKVRDGNLATASDVGLSRPEIFEARRIRNAVEREPGIIRRVLEDILDAGDEPTKARLRKELGGPIRKIRAAQQALKKQRRAVREIELAGKIVALPDRRYGTIYADPEWRFEPYSRETGMDRAADNHYPTSPTDEIAARDVASIAADDCALFLWATAPMLPDALYVMDMWGFAYVTHCVWIKVRAGEARGPGYWFTGEHELLLVGTRGNVPAPAPGTQFPSFLIAPVTEHSAKPEEFLERIEAYFPNLPKIELNRRGPARRGWDAWGAEAAPPEPEA